MIQACACFRKQQSELVFYVLFGFFRFHFYASTI